VIDTGVLVSAFAFGGIPERAVKKAFAEAEVFVSPDLLKEYRDVPLALESEGKLGHGQLKALISGFAAFVNRAILVNPQRKLSICRDAEDNMLLECCLEAKARFLVSGDKDLLDLRDLAFDLKVLTPRQFFEMV
jgi:putative PIN family toxin of toxin-antitoxin system